MKFGFVTCVELGLSCIEAIYDVGGTLDLVITLPDDKARTKSGRVYVDDFCGSRGVPVLKSPNVNDEAVINAIRAAGIDWLFIIGWSQIARDAVLAAPARGVLGMHPTLLPVGRGRAAIPWAILKRLDKTGVTMFKLDGGVDTGDIIAQREIALTPATTATELYAAVDAVHIALMQEAFPQLVDDRLIAVAQDDAKATEWPGRKPEDGQIDLNGSVHDAECLVRAVTRPYPGAFVLQDGVKTIVWQAEVGSATRNIDAPDFSFADGVLHCLDWEIVSGETPAETMRG
jgi:methionyl-tRNA formyltransferase